MADASAVDRIDGKPRTVRELFSGRRYSVDYYQREYAWSEANALELLEDLSGRFLDSWDGSHERSAVAQYRPYFLGPIVTDNRSGTLFLVDGQQRVTTLTLLLIVLYHLQKERPEDQVVPVADLIASPKYGKYAFVLNVDDRESTMQALFDGRVAEAADADDSINNLRERFDDMTRLFPEELSGDALPFFVDWLLERVVVVEIGTSDQEMALEIFETMNDRGLRLTTTDMLKSYLLANIRDRRQIEDANELWRSRISELCAAESKTETDFIKHWLRAKYAESIRERRKAAVPLDFDVIGTAPHKWVRDNKENIGLGKSGDYADLVGRDFKRLSARFLELLKASQQLTPGFEEVFFNNWTGFTYQYPLILAAVTPVDDDETFQMKTRMVAGFVDLFVARRMVNYRNFGYSTVQYAMFNLMKEIRDLEPDELSEVLGAQVAQTEDQWAGLSSFGLTQRNGSHVKYLLARMTAWLEQQCGSTTTFAEFVQRSRRDPFEIEHIWANHSERRSDFVSEEGFQAQRNQLGGLLLLPKSFNASYGDKSYEEKLDHYFGQNLLARSLHSRCYENNPRFLGLVSTQKLPFVAHPDGFDVVAMRQRQELYASLCETIWNPENFGLNVPDGTEVATTESEVGKRHYGVSFGQLVQAGILTPGTQLSGLRNSKAIEGVVTSDGRIALPDGQIFDSPSTAAATALGVRACNGWTLWRAQTSTGPTRLSRLRQVYLERR